MRMKATRGNSGFLPAALSACVLLFLGACDPSARVDPEVDRWDPDITFSSSLHATAEGMRTIFNMNGPGTYDKGFGPFSQYDYENLGCKNCHASGGPPRDTCLACHAMDQEHADATCYSCHSRQGKMNNVIGETDVHRDAGIGCVGCHTWGELHGDGNQYCSQFEIGDSRITCENCHVKVKSSPSHNAHMDAGGLRKLDCSACHTKTIITCYNCHFDTFVSGGGKKAYGALTDWVFLINDARTGRVRPASFQSLSYEVGPNGDKFIVFAPFEAHTVQAAGKACSECHGETNAAIQDLNANGNITVTWWQAAALQKMTGVIPLIGPDPSGGQERLDFAYLSYDSGTTTWSELTTLPAPRVQYAYGTHITETQLDSLKTPVPGIVSVAPGNGPAAGGTSITITGSGFWASSTVTIGGALATNVVFVNSTSITCDTPAGAVGSADVVVTNATNFSATLAGGFTYQ